MKKPREREITPLSPTGQGWQGVFLLLTELMPKKFHLRCGDVNSFLILLKSVLFLVGCKHRANKNENNY